MKLTDKRFLNWRILIVLLIAAFLIAILVLFKSASAINTADIERVGMKSSAGLMISKTGMATFLSALMSWGYYTRDGIMIEKEWPR